MDVNKNQLSIILVGMDEKRKNDLIASLVDALFRPEYDFDYDQMDNVVEVIENISGVDNVQVLMDE